MANTKLRLRVGMRIKILEEGKVIDKAVIREVYGREVETESLELNPGQVTEFGRRKGEWVMLFEDPMTGRMCFSERAPTYTFEPI